MAYIQPNSRGMRQLGFILALCVTLGLAQDCYASSCGVLPSWVARVVSQLTANQQYTVQCGSIIFPVNVKAGNCTEGVANDPNPSSCYGQYYLPARTGGATNSLFELDDDEAVLFIGQMPPSSYYYGFQSYVNGRFNPLATGPGSPYINIFASIGPAVNQSTTASYPARTEKLAQLFSNSMATISTANTLTQTDITNALPYVFSASPTTAQVAAAQAMTNIEIFPSDLMELGSAAPADQLSTFIRLTPFTTNAQGTTFDAPSLAYMSQQPAFVFRVSPIIKRLHDTPRLYTLASDPLAPRKAHPNNPNDSYEQDLLTAAGVPNAQLALDAIVQNVIIDRRTNYNLAVVGSPTSLVDETNIEGRYCISQFSTNLLLSKQFNDLSYIENTPLCAADSPDAAYLSTGTSNITLTTGGQIVVVGINHGTLGSGTYSSIALQPPANALSNYAVAMTNLVLNGSASPFLGSIPPNSASNFYVATFQADCSNTAYCRIAPVNAVTPLTFVERNYLGPTTGTKPAYSDLFAPTLIVFAPQ